MSDLPGIEVLFRENRRLANKLTQDELKALKRYIQDVVAYEHGELSFQLSALRTEYNKDIRTYSDTIDALQKELKEKEVLIKHFSSSDENLANVHKKRGERLEQIQTVLVNDIETATTKCRTLSEQLVEVREDIREKTQIIIEQNSRLEQFEKLNDHIEKADRLIEENELLLKENLKFKLDSDKNERTIVKLKTDLTNSQKEKDSLAQSSENSGKEADELKKELLKHSQDMADKCEQISMLKYELEQKTKQIADMTQELGSITNSLKPKNNVSPRPTVASRATKPDRSSKSQQSGRLLSCGSDTAEGNSLLRDYEYYLFRTEVLEENIEKYKSDCGNLDFLIDQSATDEYILTEATSRLKTNSSLAVEQLLHTLFLRVRSRRSHCSASLAGLVDRLPSKVELVATSLKTDVLKLKQKCEQLQNFELRDLVSGLIPRIDVCLNTKYVSPKKRLNGLTRSAQPVKASGNSVIGVPYRHTTRSKPKAPLSVKGSSVNEPSVAKARHLEKRRSSSPSKFSPLSPTQINLSMSCILPQTLQLNKTRTFNFDFRPPGKNNFIVAWKSENDITIE